MQEFERLGSIHLPKGKKIYFASDFHLGVPDHGESIKREKHIVKWLEHIKHDASAIFLVGDLFDFWFEYAKAVPKGFVRFQGKIAELADSGIDIHFFTGNHDLWMNDYFRLELGVSVHKNPMYLEINNKRILVGHGDGLGKGDSLFKVIKKVFKSKLANWLFARLHPNFGIALAETLSGISRKKSQPTDKVFLGENERLFEYCRSVEAKYHHDFYVFGHRHLTLEMKVSESSIYYNLGEWFSEGHYLEFDEQHASLKPFTP